MEYLLIAVGGAFGAMARYWVGRMMVPVSAFLWGGAFPLGTMVINILGGFLMGILASRAGGIDSWGRPLLMVGFLGGFTTFSSFSLEALQMLQRGAWGQLMLYVCGSVVLSVCAVAFGVVLGGLRIVR